MHVIKTLVEYKTNTIIFKNNIVLVLLYKYSDILQKLHDTCVNRHVYFIQLLKIGALQMTSAII